MAGMGTSRRAGGERLAPETVADIAAYLERRLQPNLCPPYLAGTCLVCGSPALFYTDGWQTYREALRCSECNSTSRYRSLALGILRAIRDLTGIAAPSVAALADLEAPRRLAVYDTQTPFSYDLASYPIPDLLDRCPWIDVSVSSYRPDLPRGMPLGADSTNQDLQDLTFADASFDIVLTSDVMEHVRLDDAAHGEILRVLRPGGAYVFTVPTKHDAPTRQLILVHDRGDAARDEVVEYELHGDANERDGGAITYRVYGNDLAAELERIGFEVEFEILSRPEHAIMHTDHYYCRKPQRTGLLAGIRTRLEAGIRTR